MTTPLIIETDLKEILTQINQRLEKIDDRLGRLETSQAEIRSDLTSVKEDVQELKGSQRSQIWTLIGILSTAVIGTVIRFVLVAMPS
jgi:archaellum component FlaC